MQKFRHLKCTTSVCVLNELAGTKSSPHQEIFAMQNMRLLFCFLVPHIFVWGSCFWFCIPPLPPPPARLGAVKARGAAFCHPQLCHTHTQSFTHTTLSHTIFHTQLCHTQLCHTPSLSHTTLSHTIFVTHHFVTHQLSHTTLSHTTLSHTIFVTHNFVTHHLSHTTLSHTTLSHTILCHPPSFTQTTLSHTLFDTQLCHPPSFTHNFVTQTHTDTHTHTISAPLCVAGRRGTWWYPPSLCRRMQLCHTQLFTYNLFYFSILHHLLPSPSPLLHLLLISGRSWLVGLSGPLFFLLDYFLYILFVIVALEK